MAGAVGSWVSRHRGITIFVVAVVVIGLILYPPARELYVARRTGADLTAELDAVKASNTQLQADVGSLQSREGIEDEARRRGYVGEGEHGVDLEGVGESGTATREDSVSEDEAADTAAAPTPWYITALDHLFRYDPKSEE